MKRVLTLLRILITIYKRVEIANDKHEQSGSVLKKRREDLTIQYLVNSILDVAPSVAGTVISFLLLLSGDIEQNPGPGKTNCYVHVYSKPFTDLPLRWYMQILTMPVLMLLRY